MQPEFQNKEKLQVCCSCGEPTSIFVDDLFAPYKTVCKKCSKKIYQLTCSKCKSGFGFPEDVKNLHLSEGWWECDMCHEKNNINEEDIKTIPNYSDQEIPQEVQEHFKTPFQKAWKHWWFKLITILILLGLAVIVFGRFSNDANNSLSTTPTEVETEQSSDLAETTSNNPQIKSILENFEKTFTENNPYQGRVSQLYTASVWWHTLDYITVHDDEAKGVMLSISCTADNAGRDSQEVYDEMGRLLLPKVAEIFNKNGFVKSGINSSDSYEEPNFIGYTESYETTALKCNFTADQSCSGTTRDTLSQDFVVSCTDRFEELAADYQEEAQIARDLNFEGVYQSITINAMQDDYAHISVGGRGPGAYYVIKKADGKWKTLFGGQDLPMCSDLIEHQVPNAVYSKCYDDETELEVENPVQ